MKSRRDCPHCDRRSASNRGRRRPFARRRLRRLACEPLEQRALLDAVGLLPGQSPWQRGVMTHHGRMVSVVDTARLVMPEHVADREMTMEGYLLLVGDGNYGLLVDSINSTQVVRAEGVNWYSGNRRPWLAGRLHERLSALLSVDGILDMLPDD